MTRHYFDFFPTVRYDIDKDSTPILVTDIMHRFKLRDVLKNKTVIFYTYHVKDGEKPYHVAEKFYKRPKLDWLILITNEMLDAHFDWPMGYYDFRNYIVEKYGDIATAHQTVSHYEKILQEEEKLNDGTIIPEQNIIIDETTYNATVAASRRSISKYTYEKELNEARRIIKIIHPSYLSDILREADIIFNANR